MFTLIFLWLYCICGYIKYKHKNRETALLLLKEKKLEKLLVVGIGEAVIEIIMCAIYF